jgi:hypothetical protein
MKREFFARATEFGLEVQKWPQVMAISAQRI